MRYVFLSFLILLSACKKKDDFVEIFTESDSEVIYDLVVDFNWTADNHTMSFGNFPPSDHFSPVIGATHKDGKSIFTVGETASDGIKAMAETGGVSTLKNEINDLVADKNAFDLVLGSGGSDGSVEVKLTSIRLEKDHHFITLVSMIAPSPDWFVAVHNFDLKDSEGKWKSTVTVELFGYDAGTDSGSTFTSANSATDPRQKITQFSDDDNIVFATATFTLK